MDRPLSQSEVSGTAQSPTAAVKDAVLVILMLAVMASLATIVVLLAGLAHGS